MQSDNTATWTPEYAYAHLSKTFGSVLGHYPDIMEPFFNMLLDTNVMEERTAIMREGLRSTMKARADVDAIRAAEVRERFSRAGE